jgi:hypothetical protein
MVESLASIADINITFVTLGLFFVAALMEIGGGYLVWKWIREKRGIIIGLSGGIVLFLYSIIPTLQPVRPEQSINEILRIQMLCDESVSSSLGKVMEIIYKNY